MEPDSNTSKLKSLQFFEIFENLKFYVFGCFHVFGRLPRQTLAGALSEDEEFAGHGPDPDDARF
jgi:hypothetical protein